MRKVILWIIKNVPTAWMLKYSEGLALKAFRSFLAKSALYKKICLDQGTPHGKIRSIDDFKAKVPLLDKEIVFVKNSGHEFLPASAKSQIATFLVSSGSSSQFSFGFKNSMELKDAGNKADRALALYYHTSREKTVIVNSLAMGAKVYTDLICVDVGPHVQRTVAAITMALRLGAEQVFAVSLGHVFMKQIVEIIFAPDFDKEALDYKTKVYFITGGEFLPESARSYCASKRGAFYDQRGSPYVTNCGGVTELFLNSLFFENPNLIKIRSLMQSDHRFCQAFKDYFSIGDLAVPSLFNWDPTSSYLEIIDGQIVVTNLNFSSELQLVRYRLDDRGVFLAPERLAAFLAAQNLQQLMPEEKLPMIAFLGRGKGSLDKLVQEKLYELPLLSDLLCGNFILSEGAPGPRVSFQLKKDRYLDNQLQSQLEQVKGQLRSCEALKGFEFEFCEFSKFAYNMNINYENKIKYHL